ncbi:MAG: hypothetical protein IH921_02435 [Gemmatimonadetes bacterium]|nr:hypothetical protein [Gemmatimonadota bacterium]
MILFLQILGAVGALALGLYLGAGRYTQTQQEIDVRMGGGKPRRAKRHFMWLDYFKAQERASVRRRTRVHFRTEMPRPSDPVPPDQEPGD